MATPELMAPTTELEAVNYMLALIGEQPVTTLETDGLSEASLAKGLLHNTSRAVQAKGLHFNSESDYPLVPNSEGHVVLPANALKADATDPFVDVCQRGNQMYDRTNHTDVFSSMLYADIVFFFEWELVPQVVRDYILIKASRQFVMVWGGETTFRLTEDDERRAYSLMESTELENADYNIFNSYAAARVINRRVNPR